MPADLVPGRIADHRAGDGESDRPPEADLSLIREHPSEQDGDLAGENEAEEDGRLQRGEEEDQRVGRRSVQLEDLLEHG